MMILETSVTEKMEIRDTEGTRRNMREDGTSVDRYIAKFCADHRFGRCHDDDDRILEY